MNEIEVTQSEDDWHAMALAIGSVILQWAVIEHALDMIVGTSFQHLGGRAFQQQLPKMMRVKIIYLLKCFKTLEPLKPYRSEAVRLLRRIRREKDLRNDFAHCSLSSLKHVNGVFTFNRIEITPTVHVIEPWKFDVRSFEAHVNTLVDLQKDTLDFAGKILAAFPMPAALRR